MTPEKPPKIYKETLKSQPEQTEVDTTNYRTLYYHPKDLLDEQQ